MLFFEKDLPKGLDYLKLWYTFCNMGKAISPYYVYDLFSDRHNKVVLYGIDHTLTDVENCPCGLIYRIHKNVTENELHVYIMFIATEYKCRKTGYASLLINEFIDFIKEKYCSKYTNISIILDSIEPAVTFYEHFGFKWTVTETKYNDMFHIDDTNNDEHFVMVYRV